MIDPNPPARQSLRRWKSAAVLLTLILVIISASAYAIALLIAGAGPSGVTVRSVPVDPSEDSATAYAFAFHEVPVAVPDLVFADASGRPVSLSDFRGRSVLLNIWATWCVPCRKEMPSLDRLQAEFDPSKLLVLTLSIDLQGAAVVRKFYHDLGLRSLGIYVDTTGSAGNKLGLPGVPGTLLIDARGREVGRKLGPAEWDSPAVDDLLREHLGLGAADGNSRGRT